jgi:hypothetical protein
MVGDILSPLLHAGTMFHPIGLMDLLVLQVFLSPLRHPISYAHEQILVQALISIPFDLSYIITFM